MLLEIHLLKETSFLLPCITVLKRFDRVKLMLKSDLVFSPLRLITVTTFQCYSFGVTSQHSSWQVRVLVAIPFMQ